MPSFAATTVTWVPTVRPADLDGPRTVVVADTAGRWPRPEVATSDFMYVRLHGDVELYTSGYSAEALDRWAARCLEWAATQDVFVYFDNDVKGYAPHDAVALLERVQKA